MPILAYYISLDTIAAEKKASSAETALPLLPGVEEGFIAALQESIAAASPSHSIQQAALDFALRLTSEPEWNIEECLAIIGRRFAELYLVEGMPKPDSLNGRAAALSNIAKPHSHLDGLSHQNAVTQFLRSALGWMPNGEHDAAHVETFRRAHALATENGLTGVAINRLFQRAVWLFEKVRLETDFFRNPIAVDEILLELAGKIFGGLKDRTALLIGNNDERRQVVKTLQGAGIGRLYLASTTEEKPDLANLQIIASWHEIAELPYIDLLLLFDHAERNVVTRPYIQKLMAARHQAPLLLADLTSRSETPTGIEKLYNLFFFRRRDLEEMAGQNVQARRQVEAEVAAWIKAEVRQFYQWLASEDRFQFGLMVGRSRQMQQVFELIARIAQTDITVLIEGESGTGKELVARAIQQSSARSRRPFIAVNCGALPENLLESELFGHVRGAFTGAVSHKAGLFEAVNGGTIFLDEIAEMSPALQVQLLRFLQDGEIKRVGSNAVLKLDVRVLAATNRHLQTLVNEDKFRSDLYYRLNVIGINLPPLRERPEDIEILAQHFIKKFANRMRKPIAALAPEVLQRLRHYAWPGNVRELENVIERAVALTVSPTLEVADLPVSLREASNPLSVSTRLPLKEIERQYILETVNACNGNYDEAARLLGIGRTTLWRKLKIYSNENGDSDEI